MLLPCETTIRDYLLHPEKFSRMAWTSVLPSCLISSGKRIGLPMWRYYIRKVTLPAYSATDKQTVAQKSVLFNSFALAIQYHTSRIVEFAQISVVTNSFDAAIHWRSDYLALG